MSIELATSPSAPPAIAEGEAVRPMRRARGRWRLTDVLALAWLIALVFSMLFLPMILGLDANKIVVQDRLAGPSAQHLLGADNLGRDLLARSLAGARVSLLIGFGSVAAAAVIGIPIGMVAGYLRGWFNSVTAFIVDVILAFPGLILALALASFLGASVTNVMIAITVPMFPVFVRLARAQTLAVTRCEYVEASQVIGTPLRSILWRDVRPNITEAMAAFALVSVGNAILIEGGLSFLGMGVPSTEPSWGSMINYGRDYISSNPSLIGIPSAFMLLTILSLNLLSDRYLARNAGARR